MRSTSNLRKPGTVLNSNLPSSTTFGKRPSSVQPSQRFGIQSSLQNRATIQGTNVTAIPQDPPSVPVTSVAISIPMPKSARKAPASTSSNSAPSVTDRIRAVYAAAAQERPDFDNTYAKVTDRPIPKHNLRMDFKVRCLLDSRWDKNVLITILTKYLFYFYSIDSYVFLSTGIPCYYQFFH
jgi:hypothetical protein